MWEHLKIFSVFKALAFRSIIEGRFFERKGNNMVKGTQRQMVMVRTDDSECFEMAYFLLRANGDEEREKRSMIDEANSIVSSVCGNRNVNKREKVKKAFFRILLFSCGAAFGAAVLWLCFSLFL